MNRESERQRLVELIDECCKEELGANLNKDILEKFAEHLLDNGIGIRPADELCYMLGDIIFVIDEGEVDEVLLTGLAYDYEGNDILSTYDDQDEKVRNYKFADFDKTVFLSREEAEKMLKGEWK